MVFLNEAGPAVFWGPAACGGRALAPLAARSALRRLQRLGLPPAAARLQATRPVASLLCRLAALACDGPIEKALNNRPQF